MTEGGCECGQVRYRMAGPPIFVNACHCRQCQRLTGSAFAINAMIEADRVTSIGTLAPHDTDDGRGQPPARCPACGTGLWGRHPLFGTAILFLRAGTLDEGEAMVPDAHFFVRSRHPWIALPDGVARFATLPGPGDPPLFDAARQARVDAAMARGVRGPAHRPDLSA